MKSQTRDILYPFEGFNFELIVTFHTNMAGVFIEKIEPTNLVKGNYCKQDFYHHLNVLSYSIIRGECDKEVKKILTQVLNYEDRYPTKQENFIKIVLITLSIIALIALFVI